jgi:hypothetical protein
MVGESFPSNNGAKWCRLPAMVVLVMYEMKRFIIKPSCLINEKRGDSVTGAAAGAVEHSSGHIQFLHHLGVGLDFFFGFSLEG